MSIKAKLALFTGLFALSGGLLASCGGGGEAAPLELEITFDTNGGSSVAKQTVKYGEKAKKPSDPTKEGYVFDGWFADKALKVEFDFSQEITADWTIYAGWTGGSEETSTESVETSDIEQSSQEEQITSEEEPSSNWTMTFIDASWWNEAAAATAYTLQPAEDGRGDYSYTPTTYDSATGYDTVSKTNHWFVEIPADAVKIQFFRVGGNTGREDWGARTVVIDLTARAGKTTWALDGTATWYGDGGMATGSWVE